MGGPPDARTWASSATSRPRVSIPFSVHTTDGEPFAIRVRGADREAAAFPPFDDALAGYVMLDFDAFDAWFEEDERNVAHPRDPFHASTSCTAHATSEPLREAAEVTDRIAFFNERVDLGLDGTPLERPITPWSRR